jgi:hypothetical protein
MSLTLFCPIIDSHLNNCLSLASILQNMISTYIIFSISVFYLLKMIKSNHILTKTMYTYYGIFKMQSFLFDIFTISIAMSLTFMLLHIIKNTNIYVTKNTFLSFMILYNLVMLSIVLSINMIFNDKHTRFVKFCSYNSLYKSLYFIISSNFIVVLSFLFLLGGFINILAPVTNMMGFIHFFIM